MLPKLLISILHPNHVRIPIKQKEVKIAPPHSSRTTTTIVSEEDKELPSNGKVTVFRWYHIDNNNDSENSSCPDYNRQNSRGWRRITNNDHSSSSNSD